MSNDNNITCRIKRSDRPCLICSGMMDLIEARPQKFNLFGGIPLVCGAEGIDCLDCPKCGFTTTTSDYQYLRLCKNDRQTNPMFTNFTMDSESKRRDTEPTRRRQHGHRIENSISRSISFSNGNSCSSCQAPLESNSWKFCPRCGNKCSSPTSASPVSQAPQEASIKETNIPDGIPKDIIITDDNIICNYASENDNQNYETSTDSNSVKNEFVRMVTPPKRTSMTHTDYLGSVEMQY